MNRLYVRKECEDCSTRMEIEVLDEVLDKLRVILRVPEGKDIVHHAERIMKSLDDLSEHNS